MAIASKALIQSPLPELRYGPRLTRRDSTHNLEYRQTLVYWSKFEQAVREACSQQDRPEDALEFEPKEQKLADMNVCCGDERSVVGRFQQHVGQVMSVVFHSLRLKYAFGDFKTVEASTRRTKIPDIVILKPDGTLLAVGEAKTPWAHKLRMKMQCGENIFRHMIGQIASYMRLTGQKYGFLTTYCETMFFMQQKLDDGKWALWYSNVIDSTTASQPEIRSEDPTDYHGTVTVRECFVFLALQIAQRNRADNNMALGSWAPSKRASRKTLADHISDSNIPPPVPRAEVPEAPPKGQKRKSDDDDDDDNVAGVQKRRKKDGVPNSQKRTEEDGVPKGQKRRKKDRVPNGHKRRKTDDARSAQQGGYD